MSLPINTSLSCNWPLFWFLSPSVLRILELHVSGIIHYFVLCLASLAQCSVCKISSILFYLLFIFLLLSSIWLYEQATIHVFILLLMDFGIVSSVGLLWIILLWILLSICFSGHMLPWFCFSKYSQYVMAY